MCLWVSIHPAWFYLCLYTHLITHRSVVSHDNDSITSLSDFFYFHTQISLLNTLFSHFSSNLCNSPVFLVLLSVDREWNLLVLWARQPLETTLGVYAIRGSALKLFWDPFKNCKHEENQASLISEMLGGKPTTLSLRGNSSSHCALCHLWAEQFSFYWSFLLASDMVTFIWDHFLNVCTTLFYLVHKIF